MPACVFLGPLSFFYPFSWGPKPVPAFDSQHLFSYAVMGCTGAVRVHSAA